MSPPNSFSSPINMALGWRRAFDVILSFTPILSLNSLTVNDVMPMALSNVII